MISALPLTLLFLVFAATAPRSREGAACSALASSGSRISLVWLLLLSNTALAARVERVEKRSIPTQTFPNGTNYVWAVDDTYEGSSFFDTFEFYTGDDPTHGSVNYTDRNTAFADGLAYVESDGIVVMKGDNTTSLSEGQNRNSVRISSQKQYNTGLFILDLDMAPWGCGTSSSHRYPSRHSLILQVSGLRGGRWEAAPGPGNAGCGVTEWSRASYGPIFDEQGGGVFAMKWDVSGIGVWSFYRAAVPQDVTNGQPTPSTWGEPVAFLEASGCDPITNFVNHSIIFDITFCGDWAGNDYGTSGCPGTCAQRLMDPSNFNNASWRIRSLTVYRQQIIHGQVTSDATHPILPVVSLLGVLGILFGVLM
ncbi:hypothetical protein EVJ58_g225 [Rhodofomes roseus]|uniref:GH16 domain-containing protein n=1 Tax=Rhodofomes roseus TaxID=34475 RepID=A0A4Y9Z7J2_9APHY|nr:hypothetical protein EVJ58_g225 [Rhodofomes roseus]